MSLLILVICVVLQVLMVQSGGTGTIRFIQYVNPTHQDENYECCETHGTTSCPANECDPYFHICLDPLPPVGGSSCVYGETTTLVSNNTDLLNFGDHIGSLTNPVVFNFTSIRQGMAIKIKVSEKDQHQIGIGTDDVIGTINTEIHVTPDTYGRPTFNTTTLSGGSARVTLEFSFVCEEHYFGDCATLCQPSPSRYDCNNSGQRICKSGWSGANCDVRNLTCSPNPCQNGGSCIGTLPTRYFCDCPPGTTGNNCGSFILNSTLQNVTKSTTPTIETTTSQVLLSSTWRGKMTEPTSGPPSQTSASCAVVVSSKVRNGKTRIVISGYDRTLLKQRDVESILQHFFQAQTLQQGVFNDIMVFDAVITDQEAFNQVLIVQIKSLLCKKQSEVLASVTIHLDEVDVTTHTTAIVGGVVGGVCFLLLLFLILFLLFRYWKKRTGNKVQIEDDSS